MEGEKKILRFKKKENVFVIMEEMRFLLSAGYTRKIKSDDQLSYKATRNRFGLMC